MSAVRPLFQALQVQWNLSNPVSLGLATHGLIKGALKRKSLRNTNARAIVRGTPSLLKQEKPDYNKWAYASVNDMLTKQLQ